MKFLILILFLSFHSAFADSIELAPIIKNADTPGDALATDSVLPQIRSINQLDSPTGGIDEPLRNQIAAPVTSQGVGPGSLSQFRGFGKSAEDIDFQALGISLSPPQGGGYSLQIFPDYLWSDFAYSLGPSVAGIDPQSVSGTLILTPWTASALARKGRGERFTSAGSTLGYAQFSGGIRSSEQYAAIAGLSVGHFRGPSAGISSEWKMGGATAYAHLLATSVTSDLQGSLTFPTPNETLLTQRVIPILQIDVPLSKESLLKTSLFYDGNYLDDEDPSRNSVSISRIQQVGTQNALFTGAWKFGASLRGVTYHSSFADAPNQSILNLQVSREIDLGEFFVEPTLQGLAVTDQGFFPGGSLGLKTELTQNLELFSRTSLSHKTASLLQRYFQDQFDLANPTLSPETDYTEVVGARFQNQKGGATLQALMQQRSNVQVFGFLPSGAAQTTNQGSASLVGLTANSYFLVLPSLKILDAVTWNSSQLDATNQAFPFLPSWINNLTLSAFPTGWGRNSHLDLEWRTATSATTVSNASFTQAPLPGYGVVNLAAKTEIYRGITGGVRADNLFDKPIQGYPGYPYEGRSFSLFLSGDLE